MKVDLHFSGDFDTTTLWEHFQNTCYAMLPDGTYWIVGDAMHSTVRDHLEVIPDVTLFPHRHGNGKLGAKADKLKSLKDKAPQSSHTTYEALTMLISTGIFGSGLGGVFNPEVS